MFAEHGARTVIYDTNVRSLERIARGEMPHLEAGGQEMLERVLRGGLLEISADPEPLRDCQFWVMTIGTPVDEHLNPSFSAIRKSVGRPACLSARRAGVGAAQYGLSRHERTSATRVRSGTASRRRVLLAGTRGAGAQSRRVSTHPADRERVQ